MISRIAWGINHYSMPKGTALKTVAAMGPTIIERRPVRHTSRKVSIQATIDGQPSDNKAVKIFKEKMYSKDDQVQSLPIT